MDELCQDFVSSDLLRLKDLLRILTRPPATTFVYTYSFCPSRNISRQSGLFSIFSLYFDVRLLTLLGRGACLLYQIEAEERSTPIEKQSLEVRLTMLSDYVANFSNFPEPKK